MTIHMQAAVTAACIAAFSCSSAAQDAALPTVRLAPDDLEWVDEANGVSRTLIAGSNQTPGMYVYRVRFPQGFRNQPHFHPDDRTVTVISGTLDVGFGDVFEESALRPLPPGSVWTEPGGEPHFVWARTGAVVIQVIGVGPSGTTQVE